MGVSHLARYQPPLDIEWSFPPKLKNVGPKSLITRACQGFLQRVAFPLQALNVVTFHRRVPSCSISPAPACRPTHAVRIPLFLPRNDKSGLFRRRHGRRFRHRAGALATDCERRPARRHLRSSEGLRVLKCCVAHCSVVLDALFGAVMSDVLLDASPSRPRSTP